MKQASGLSHSSPSATASVTVTAMSAGENTMADESRDPDHGDDSRSESGTENPAEEEVTPAEDATVLRAPGSTAEGSGTSLGAVPDEARRGAAPLGGHGGTGAPGQLADERWRRNGENPLG